MAYKYIYTNRCQEVTEVSVRNVGNKNPEAALQFVISQDRGKRRRHYCFDLPAEQIPVFLEAIQKID